MKRTVIDTDSLARVFDEGNKEHSEYKPILDGIVHHRNLTIVYGGKKYLAELGRASRYRTLLSQLKTAMQAELIDSDAVNQREEKIIEDTKGTKCDDQHIIAIVIVGKCDVICSNDGNAYPFFKNPNLYPKRFKRPGIYSGLGSRTLLN